MISVACYGQASSGSPNASFIVAVGAILGFLGESVVGACVLWLVDRHGGVINLTSALIAGNTKTDTGTESTGKGTSANTSMSEGYPGSSGKKESTTSNSSNSR